MEVSIWVNSKVKLEPTSEAELEVAVLVPRILNVTLRKNAGNRQGEE